MNGAQPTYRVGIYGGPLDTGNLGVSALGTASVRGLEQALPGVQIVLFDHGRGARAAELVGEGWRCALRLRGSSYSRRVYRPWNLRQLALAAQLGLRALHPALRELAQLDALLDISGGDSFADLYGEQRFRAVCAPKWLALQLGVPLILLPQTYGPFGDAQCRQQAAQLLRAASQSWARDAHSLAVVRELLGESFEPERQRLGVDVAFGLPRSEPPAEVVRAIGALRAGSSGPLLGLNVSGLLYHGRDPAHARLGLKVEYAPLLRALAEQLLAQPAHRLLLVPHVCPPCTPGEDDSAAARAVWAQLPAALRSRALVVPALATPGEAKWVVGQCEWFLGSRMHACIAGLSQGVPTATIAYSDKSLGVFESAGACDDVWDARAHSPEAIRAAVLASVERRAAQRERLAAALPGVRAAWQRQFEAIAAAIRTARGSGESSGPGGD